MKPFGIASHIPFDPENVSATNTQFKEMVATFRQKDFPIHFNACCAFIDGIQCSFYVYSDTVWGNRLDTHRYLTSYEIDNVMEFVNTPAKHSNL